MTDTPQPGEYVYKETPWDDYNKTRCVPNSKWEVPESDDPFLQEVGDDEFVTESMNSMRILDKRSADEVERDEDGKWVIPYEEDE